MLKVNTKKILADSFCELLEEKTVESISVQNIVDYCGASRTTFYNHFTDKYGVMLWIYENDIEKIWQQMNSNWEEKETHILEYFSEKRLFYLRISSYVGQNSIQEGIKSRMIKNTENILKEKLQVALLPDEIRDAVILYSDIVIDEIFGWLKCRKSCSMQQLLKRINAFMPMILAQYFMEQD